VPDKIDLPGGGWAEIRTELTGGDQKQYLIKQDELLRSNGTGTPAVTGPDPDNPAVMKTVPAVDPVLTTADNIAMLDEVAGWLILSWSRPEPLPWTPATREALPIEVVEAVDTAMLRASRRFLGLPPKQEPSGATSATTSKDDADAPRTAPPAQPSSTPAAS
jgi:hypothetical protein